MDSEQEQSQEQKLDPEAELSYALRKFQKLAPICSVEKRRRVKDAPQLVTQKKLVGSLSKELGDTKLSIQIARKGRYAIQDENLRIGLRKSIFDFDHLNTMLRIERFQQSELDSMNYLVQKLIVDLTKQVPSEADELAMLEDAHIRLSRMENRLELVTKRFCVINTDNMRIREEIHRLLVERKSFDVHWRRTIGKLKAGKEYLMDILEMATVVFTNRDEMCRKLTSIKWKGLFQLNKDIGDMHDYEGDLNHLAKLEEFLRVKSGKRICEADEIAELKKQEEIAMCEREIARLDELLEKIYTYIGTSDVHAVEKEFKSREIQNDSYFVLLCNLMHEHSYKRKGLEDLGQVIMDQRDINESREERQQQELEILKKQLSTQRKRNEINLNKNYAAEEQFRKSLHGIEEMIRVSRCDFTPLLTLLGNQKEVTRWNVHTFLRLLEIEAKNLVHVAFGIAKPPKGRKDEKKEKEKLVADPRAVVLQPNKITDLVPYTPCAYCVEDFIMNLVFESPAVPATKGYIESIFHLQDINTKFGIFTLTDPKKLHLYRDNAY